MISKQSIEGLTDQGFESDAYGDDLQFIQEKYKSLFERRLHCIYVHDLDGQFIDANDAALKLLGYNRDELFSLNFSTLIEEDDLAVAFEVARSYKFCKSKVVSFYMYLHTYLTGDFALRFRYE